MKIVKLLILLRAILINGRESTSLQPVSCSEAGQVQYVQIFEVGPTLVVVWQEPENVEHCDFKYNVVYSSRLGTQEAVTGDLHYTFDYESLPCDLGQVSITPVYNNEIIEAAIHTEQYGSDFGGVTDILLYEEDGSLWCSWSDPPNTDLCDFKYIIQYEDENGYSESIVTTSRDTVFNYTLTPCLNSSVTITPIFGEKEGSWKMQTYEAIVGIVTNFQLDSDSGEVFAKFDPPLNTERCDLTYEISQSKKDCFIKTIAVWAISGSGKEGIAQSNEIETEIPAVGDLDVEVSNGIVSMSWSRPANTVDCHIKYEVQFDWADIWETENTNIQLQTNMPPCHVAVAAVWPVSSSGKKGSVANTIYERGIGSVLNLSMEMIDGNLVATWDIPEDWNDCVLSFLLEYNDGTDTHITVSEETSFSFVYNSCKSADIMVTPYTASGLKGVSSRATKSALGPVLNMAKSENDQKVTITWEKPANSDQCGELTYEITYGDGLGSTTDQTSYDIPIADLPRCEEAVISVTPKSASITGEDASIIYEAALGPVLNMAKTEDDQKVIIMWEKPANSDQCGQLTYEITYGDGFGATTDQTSYDIPIADLPRCEETVISVTPKSASMTGEDASTIYEPALGPVLNMDKIENYQEVIITWEKPANSDQCGELTYEITYGDGLSSTTDQTSYDIPIADLPRCEETVISVTPKSESITGEWASINYEAALGHVLNMAKYESDNKLTVMWDKPANSDQCGQLTYEITYGDELDSIVDETSYEILIADLPQCTETVISVIPKSESITGEWASIYYEPALGPVLNMQTTENDYNLIITWDKPANSDQCGQLTYEITYGDELDSIDDETVYEILLTDLPQCTETVISVTPKSESITGEGASINHETALGPVLNIATVENDNKLRIMWDKPANGDQCGQLTYEITYGDEIDSIVDQTSYEILIADLPQCTETVISVTPKSESITGERASINHETGCPLWRSNSDRIL